MKSQELIAKVLELDTQKKSWTMTKDMAIGAHRLLTQAQLADAAPILARMLQKVIESLDCGCGSVSHDPRCVVTELDRMAKGDK